MLSAYISDLNTNTQIEIPSKNIRLVFDDSSSGGKLTIELLAYAFFDLSQYTIKRTSVSQLLRMV